WNHLASYARLPASLEDIRLLLDQQSEAQSDRVLRQFGFRQPIPVAPEVLDDHHKIDIRQLHTDWPRFWSHYIQIWEDRYDYIPTRKPIIVLELACVPEYMHGLGSMASRIYCRQRRDSGNYVSKGNDVSL
ncbi:hypothetical protein Goshw_001606, partial [Gossypium schwendimanii]|nr:hypothetical protein [Gossypium schwendimanii]